MTENMNNGYSFKRSVDLFKRAAEVIPGGIYGTKAPGFVIPGSFPFYFDRGKGCRLWDADGNEYIDYMCGYGSQILGYANDAVDRAANEQMNRGDLLVGPSPIMVDLAEEIVGKIKGMDWAIFAKNGSDTTSMAVSMARIHTGRRKILMADGAYHGSADWCSSNDFPILTAKQDVHTFTYNDIEGLRNLYTAYRGEIAAIILTPYHHPAFGKQIMPADGFYSEVERLCEDEGSLFIMDDIRCNFRLSLAGSHDFFGTQPDFITMGKSIANGQPISLLMGKKELMKLAGSYFATGTFWMSGVPFAASLATLKIMKEIDHIGHINRMGKMLKEGLVSLGKDAGFGVEFSGADAIPFMTFAGDPDLYLNQIFCSEMTRRGVYFHPHHNWFISYAHKESDIEQTLETARTAFARTAELKG